MAIDIILCLKVSHDILDLSNIHTVQYRVTGQGRPLQSEEKKISHEIIRFVYDIFWAIYFIKLPGGRGHRSDRTCA